MENGKIVHVINPVNIGTESDLFVAQPVTFRTMEQAKATADASVAVQLCSIGYPEDEAIVPSSFTHLSPLERSVRDLACFRRERKLPLIADILDSTVKNTESDFIIYSNVDISLMTYFYETVALETKKHDALVINRRTIQKCDDSNMDLCHFYAQVGETHPGFDCFVFEKSLYEKFYLGNACIGANWIGRVLICNLLAYAESPKILTDKHLTFHLGDDRSWKTPANADYDQHNERVVGELIGRIKEQGLLGRHPLLEQTYDEFFLKSKDPDPSRHQISENEASRQHVRRADLSRLPREYRPSSHWDHLENNALKQDPVFIVGYPRSGTTLLQSLVATQYTPAIFPETHFFSIARAKLVVSNDRIKTGCLADVMTFLSEKLELSLDLEHYVHEMAVAGELSPKMLFEALVFDQLSKRIDVVEIPNTPWIEKTPDHVEHLDVISRYYPDAKIIFIVRDPEKAILSRRKHFTWSDEASWPIEKHARKWLSAYEQSKCFQENNPTSLHRLRLEDLLANKESELRKLCDFLGVEFIPNSVMNYPKFGEQQSLTWETWKDAASGQLKTGHDRNVECLSNPDREILQNIVANEASTLGYDIAGPSYTRRSKWLVLIDKMRNTF